MKQLKNNFKINYPFLTRVKLTTILKRVKKLVNWVKNWHTWIKDGKLGQKLVHFGSKSGEPGQNLPRAHHYTTLHHTTLHYTTLQYIQDMNSYQPVAMKSFPENALKRVGDFKHLGSHIMCLAKDFRKRKDQAWNACNKLEKVWRSNLPNNFKLDLQVSL